MQDSYVKNISVTDKQLLEPFKELPQPLKKLFATGDRGLLEVRHRVAIVGSRKMTSYGKRVTTDIAKELSRAGVTIISGLAIGIDSVAHRAALEVGGKTIAVLPGPIYKVYPPSHSRLAKDIVSKGGLLLSEYDEPEQPMKYQFIERNRLIAALADIVLITEAGEASGSLHTAEFAQELGKTVAVTPGNIDSPMSKGANKLFYEGATPVFSSRDILDLLGIKSARKTTYIPENEFETALINTLGAQPKSTDEVLDESRLDPAAFNIYMTMLELKGVVEQTGNKWRLN